MPSIIKKQSNGRRLLRRRRRPPVRTGVQGSARHPSNTRFFSQRGVRLACAMVRKVCAESQAKHANTLRAAPLTIKEHLNETIVKGHWLCQSLSTSKRYSRRTSICKLADNHMNFGHLSICAHTDRSSDDRKQIFVCCHLFICLDT